MQDELMASATILLRCPKCGRRISVPRNADDPVEAAVMKIICPRCDDGDRHEPRYFRKDGDELLFGRDFGFEGAPEPLARSDDGAGK